MVEKHLFYVWVQILRLKSQNIFFIVSSQTSRGIMRCSLDVFSVRMVVRWSFAHRKSNGSISPTHIFATIRNPQLQNHVQAPLKPIPALSAKKWKKKFKKTLDKTVWMWYDIQVARRDGWAGLRRTTGNRVCGNPVPRVRISLSPPKKSTSILRCFFASKALPLLANRRFAYARQGGCKYRAWYSQ